MAQPEIPYQKVGEKILYSDTMLKKIATDMANTSLDLQHGNKLLVEFHPGADQLKEHLVNIARHRGVEIRVLEYNPVEKAKQLKELDPQRPHDFSDEVAEYKANAEWAEKVAYLYAYEEPQAFQEVDRAILSSFNTARSAIYREVANTKRRVITHLPTPAEALREKMDFDDYVRMYYDACNLDWEEVVKAQDILINEILNPGKKLELLADFDNETEKYRTHLSMSIDGMTFANSTINANYPGSEVFSAPVAGTIEGRLSLPYPVMFAGKQLPNLTLVFEKGQVVSYQVDDDPEMQDYVKSIFENDEGVRQAGEVALGTNPSFWLPMLNPLFVEKVGGSFHIALGSAYKFTKYAERYVHVDNGVVSKKGLHIDLTRMMTGQYGGGKVIVDDRVIQEKGFFKDDRLAILNPVIQEA